MWGRMYGIVHLFRVPTLSYGIFPELSFVGAMYSRSNKSKVVRLEWFESCDRWNVFTFAWIVSAFDYRLRGIHLNATRTRGSYELPTLCSTTTSLIHLYCFCLSPPSSFTPFPLPPFSRQQNAPLCCSLSKNTKPPPTCVEPKEAVKPVKPEPKDLLSAQKCLDALANLRHAKWFQVWLSFWWTKL